MRGARGSSSVVRGCEIERAPANHPQRERTSAAKGPGRRREKKACQARVAPPPVSISIAALAARTGNIGGWPLARAGSARLRAIVELEDGGMFGISERNGSIFADETTRVMDNWRQGTFLEVGSGKWAGAVEGLHFPPTPAISGGICRSLGREDRPNWIRPPKAGMTRGPTAHVSCLAAMAVATMYTHQ